MPPVTPVPQQQPRRIAPLIFVAAFAYLTPAVRADDAPPAGIIVPVRADHMWQDAQRLELAVKKPLRRFETFRGLDPARKEVFKVICDFNPDGQPSGSDKYEDCLKLARLLRKLQNERGVLTVAWVHGEVSRHSVLPVLACEERIFSDDDTTKLGKVIDRGMVPLEPGQVAEYRQITAGRFTWPFFVQKMYDRELLVVKVDRGGLKPEETYRAVPPDRPLGANEVPVENLQRGATALYNFEQAREFNLSQRDPVVNLPDLRKRYDLPETAVLRQPERPVVCRIGLTGTIGGGLKEQLQRRLDRAREQRADVVILQIGCGDGDVGKAVEMAQMILKLGDSTAGRTIETIAYVMPEARSTAALLVLACDRIVMNPKAELGNFDRYLEGQPEVEIEVRARLSEVAEKQGVPAALARALATRDAHLHWVSSVKGDTDRTFLEQTRFEVDQARPDRRWKSIEELRPAQKGGYLTLSADAALKYGVSDKTADDWTGACEWAGIDPKEVRLISNDLLDQIAEFLREPVTQGILIMIAITCLILELKMPGTAIPGILSAVCFVLFFWSQSQFNEETTTLALLLFLLGLVLIAFEVFVIPGFGITGISGILLVIGSLGLMAYGHWPRSGEDWVGLGQKLTPISLSLCGAVCLAFMLARYLPHIPGANRLIMKPAGMTVDGEEAPDHSGALDLAPLLGAIGVAVSSLRPAGKMQIGDEFVDVVAEGGYIAPGTRVQVIEIEGNRIVVKEV